MPDNKNLKIQLVPVNTIIPYWRNPRHNDRTVEWLIQIIPQYGFNVPIVLDKNNVVVKGHARLKAAKRLGMEMVPCIYTDNDDEVNKADRIADNKIQEMSFWDIAKLEMEFQRIGDLKFDKLFHPEDYLSLGVMPDTSLTFTGTSLDDYGEFKDGDSYGSEFYPTTEGGQPVAPVYSGTDESEGENEGDFEDHIAEYSNEQYQSSLPGGKKALRTVCPY